MPILRLLLKPADIDIDRILLYIVRWSWFRCPGESLFKLLSQFLYKVYLWGLCTIWTPALPVPEPTMSLQGDSDMASARRSRRPSSVFSIDDVCRTPKLSGQLPHTSSSVTLRSNVPETREDPGVSFTLTPPSSDWGSSRAVGRHPPSQSWRPNLVCFYSVAHLWIYYGTLHERRALHFGGKSFACLVSKALCCWVTYA